MDAILYVFHGSKAIEANEQAFAFIKNIREKVDSSIQEVAFLEKASPSIPEAFEKCIRNGATNIIVIPVLLLTAAHIKEDIPREIHKLLIRFPGVRVTIGKAIGVHEKIINILIDRMEETQISIEDDAAVLLVGRGSSDPEVKRDLLSIGNQLKEKINKDIGVCFLAASKPSFTEGIEWAKKMDERQVFVIPYLLFSGVLMKKMEKTLKDLEENNTQWILCPSIGYHSILGEIILEQIQSLIIQQKEHINRQN